MSEKVSALITKQDLIAHTTAWNALVAYVDGLTAEQWTGPRDAAGWSVKDHVSHVTLWDRAIIAALRHQVPMQEILGISESAWSAGSFDPMNEEIRHLAVGESVAQVRADRDATWTDLVALTGELSEEQLTPDQARRLGWQLVLDRLMNPSYECSWTTGALTMWSTCRISRPSSTVLRQPNQGKHSYQPAAQHVK